MLENFFKLHENRTTVKTEVVAGSMRPTKATRTVSSLGAVRRYHNIYDNGIYSGS